MIEGLVVEELSKHIDERGFFVELLRDDHRNLLGDDHIVGTSLSYTVPGIIRAWHRHKLDQRDYLVCIGGSIKVCIFDDRLESTTRGELDEIVLSSERLQVLRVQGDCWHGYKSLGPERALVLYGVNKLYNYSTPDEERLYWNDKTVVPTSINGNKHDIRVGKVYDWNSPAHK